MEAVVEDVSRCKKLIRFSVPREDVQKEIDTAYEKIKESAFVPGFRLGKAPRKVVEMRFGGALKEEALSKILPEAYKKAIEENNLRPVEEPKFEEINYEKDRPLTFQVTVEVIPEIHVPQYKGIEIKRAKISKPSKEDIMKVLEDYREQSAKFVPVEGRAVKEGDYVVLSYEEEMEGKRNKAENQWVEMKKDSLIPGFFENVIGMNIGEKKEFNLDIPGDYHSKEIAGKKINYRVELQEIKEKSLPKLDDEFAKDVGKTGSLKEFKEVIRNGIVVQREAEAKREQEQEIIDYLVANTELEIPQRLIDAQTQRNVEARVRRGLFYGVPKEKLMEKKDEIFESASKASVSQIKLALILQKIAENEKISVGDEEIDSHIEKIAKIRKVDKDELKATFEKEDYIEPIRDDLLQGKVLSFLMENAVIK